MARTMIPHLGKTLHVRVSEGEQVPFAVVDDEKAVLHMKKARCGEGEGRGGECPRPAPPS